MVCPTPLTQRVHDDLNLWKQLYENVCEDVKLGNTTNARAATAANLAYVQRARTFAIPRYRFCTSSPSTMTEIYFKVFMECLGTHRRARHIPRPVRKDV